MSLSPSVSCLESIYQGGFASCGEAPSLSFVAHHAEALARVAESLLRLPMAEAAAEPLERIHAGACRLYRWSTGRAGRVRPASVVAETLAQLKTAILDVETVLAGKRGEDWRIELGLRDMVSCRSTLASAACGG